MRITPLDVRKQEFRKGMRGLDPEEVYAFLATVADEYETVLTDNRQLRDRVLELDEKVTEYRNMEKTLRDTLLTAERVMNEARENARKEAELILRDARVQAQQASQSSARQAETLRAQLRELRSLRDRYLARLKSLAEAQIGMVENFLQDFEEDDRDARRLENAPDAQAEPPAPDPSTGGYEEGPTADHEPTAMSHPDSASPPPAAVAPPAAVEDPMAEQMEERGEAPGWPEPSQDMASADEETMEPALAPDEAPTMDPRVQWNAEAGAEEEAAVDRWRDYRPGLDGAAPPVETVASTVAEMAEAAGAESGQPGETVPLSADLGEEDRSLEGAVAAQEEPAVVASTDETEERSKESRWSISRFTRGLGDF